jgi:DNA primase
MCDGHGNVVGIRLRNDRGKFAVRGSRQGLFISAECGVRNAERADVLFVCEGPTDTAAVLELGLFAVGRPNCCCGGPEIRTYARRQAVNRVVIVADNDRPGLDGARKVGGELKLPFAIYVPPAKDVREFVRLGGTRAMIENTLKGIVWQGG